MPVLHSECGMLCFWFAGAPATSTTIASFNPACRFYIVVGDTPTSTTEAYPVVPFRGSRMSRLNQESEYGKVYYDDVCKDSATCDLPPYIVPSPSPKLLSRTYCMRRIRPAFSLFDQFHSPPRMMRSVAFLLSPISPTCVTPDLKIPFLTFRPG
jgi:hypothetical protein